jgi:hypothetical protein
MQHNHHSQPDQMLSGCSLPSGEVNHLLLFYLYI